MSNGNYQPNTLYEVNILDLMSGIYQPRSLSFSDEEISYLAESIRSSGLLNPVQFHENEKGELELVSGERRLKACKELKWETIPAIKIDEDPNVASLVDNLLRKDLTNIEEYEAIKKLINEYSYSQKDIAVKLGKSDPTISQILSLNKINKRLWNKIKENTPECPRWILEEIAKEEDNKKQRQIYNFYNKKNLTRQEYRRGATKQHSKQILYFAKTYKTKLDEYDINSLNDEDVNTFKSNLESLRNTIDSKLQEIDNLSQNE